MTSTDKRANPVDDQVSASDVRIRRRSTVACRTCNIRKVRCNVAISGRPCANCQHDRTSCEILPRKKLGPKRKVAVAHAEQQRASAIPTDEITNIAGLKNQGLNASPLSEGYLQLASDGSQDYRPMPSICSEDAGILAGAEELEEAPNSDRFAITLDAATESKPEKNPTQTYVGDQQGSGKFIFDLCNGTTKTGLHYLIPRSKAEKPWPEDMAYLRLKGVFSIPTLDVCEDLVHCYFNHVHPFAPVIDSKLFLEEFVKNGCRNINLLLLWSMFFAAANFLEPDVLQKAGYSSRKAMKRAMYQRAKCLYDSDYEQDKVFLIQSLILMSFWYSDTEDRSGAWHWTGIAISLCQSLGLHRNPELAPPNHRLPKAKISVLSRMWWCCVMRDRWLSLALGRPMRIHSDDCEMPMPRIEDVTQEMEAVVPHVKDKFLPSYLKTAAGLWIKLLKLSEVLGTIIRVFYGSKKTRPTKEDLERCENEIFSCCLSAEEKEQTDPIALFHGYQLQLFYGATLIVLHRPYVNTFGGVSLNEEDRWQAESYQKAKSAASKINIVLERLIELDMVKYLKPMTITTLIPAIQMHLLESISPTALARRLGSHKFQLCMMVLSELRLTYWGADSMYRLFERAQEKLEERQKSVSASSKNNYVAASTLSPLAPDFSVSTWDQQAGPSAHFSNFAGDPNLELWNQQLNPFQLVYENFGNGPPLNLAFFQGESSTDGCNGHAELNQELTINGANALIGFEQFNSDFLEMTEPNL